MRIVRASVIIGLPSLIIAGVLPVNAAPRYTKREVPVESTGQSKSIPPKPRGEPSGGPRPGLDADRYRAAVRAEVEALTDAAIATLKRLIQVTEEDDPEKPDYIFRLAEHYRDKKEDLGFRARELDEKIFVEPDAGRRQQLKDAQKKYLDAEQQWLVEAIKMYLKVATTDAYSKYKRMDEVLYNVADMLTQSKREDKARLFFQKLIRNYPQSKYIPDAYLSFAEYYFNSGMIEEALRLYEQVAKYPESSIYGYSVYKQAWCWLNLKDYRKSLSLFVTVIQNATKWAGTEKGKLILVREARKDAVRAYAYIGEPNKAWNFFVRVGGSDAMRMLESLGTIYYDQGKFLESILIYKKLISLDPESKSLCKWQYSIVMATLSAKNKNEQVKEVIRLASLNKKLATQTNKDKDQTAALTECQNNASAIMRELATTWHREAQKTQNTDTYALAEHLYKAYLDNYPGEKDVYVMTFYYAELLFKIERWEPAANTYSKVVELDPQGKYLKEAAYAAVISWRNALNVKEEVHDTATINKDERYKQREIPENQRRMLAAFDTYIKHVPDSKELVAIKYRKARTYYEYNHFQDAVPIFAEVATKYPSHELAVYSADLLLDSLYILEDFDGVRTWAERFSNMPQLAANEDFKNRVDHILSGIERKRVERMKDTKNFRECGDGYARLANKYPDDPKWQELVFNAAMCYEAARLIGQAIAARSTLIRVKPDDPLAQRALFMIGENYHALAWYSRAAEYYEMFAKKFPGEENAPQALHDAIVFRLGRAEYDKAIEDVRLFEKNYGKRPKYAAQTAAVFFSLGTIYEQRRDRDGLIKHYQEYLSKWGNYGGADRKVVAHVRIGEAYWKSACPNDGVYGACIKVERQRSKRAIKRRSGGESVELRKQCGPETKSNITVIRRNPQRVAQARAQFAEALKLYSRGGTRVAQEASAEDVERRQHDVEFAAASARFHQAEEELEDFLAVEFPKNLDFSATNKRKKAESEKEFKKYLDNKGKKLTSARSVYQDVIKMKVAHWAIAASARIGQLFQNFADALYTAPVPKPQIPPQLSRDMREDFLAQFTDAYCDKLEDWAGTQETKAIEGLAACLTKSTELSWYNEWSTMCESELNQISPAEYPIAAEIRANAGYLGIPAARAEIVQEVGGAAAPEQDMGAEAQ